MLEENRGELEERFPSFFVPVFRLDYAGRQVSEKDRILAAVRDCALSYGLRAMIRCGEGGIFKALWDLGEECGSGLLADMKKIPVRQETIEICEYYGRNPYTEDSAGMAALAVSDGYGLTRALSGLGISSALAGMLTPEKGKTLKYREHLRYIDKWRPAKAL